ncbi:hypothetical protein [uncultured Hymenobacter sp.]|uniref:hypothetical protein n=1 Tax=uncultured Hymenobacter sp. TaxID=170016 RepID=UPI0035CB63DF
MRRHLLLTAHCSLLTAFSGCNSDNSAQPRIPYAPVNLALDLTNQQYRALRFDNGVVALPARGPAGTGGVRGVLIVRQNASSYLAFERNCPYRPTDECARVGFDTSPAPFLRDSCCGSQFSLQGQVTGGPAPRALLQYSTSLSGNQLNITN